MKNTAPLPASPAPTTPARKPATGKQKEIEDLRAQVETLTKQLGQEKTAHGQTTATLKARIAADNEQVKLRTEIEGKLAKATDALAPFYEATKKWEQSDWPPEGAVVVFNTITAGNIKAARETWLALRA